MCTYLKCTSLYKRKAIHKEWNNMKHAGKVLICKQTKLQIVLISYEKQVMRNQIHDFIDKD